jgi:hypothetical protein
LGIVFADSVTAMRAGVVLAQPRGDTLMVEPMVTREFGDLFSNIDFVHADAAISATIVSQHIDGDWLAW